MNCLNADTVKDTDKGRVRYETICHAKDRCRGGPPCFNNIEIPVPSFGVLDTGMIKLRIQAPI